MSKLRHPFRRPLHRAMRRLAINRSGVAMIEFAIALPFFLAAGLGGVETSYFALSNMRVAQLAVQLADNASRVGDTSTLENRRVFETDINDVFIGANIHGGKLDFFKHGRAIISSLQVSDPCGGAVCSAAGDQTIVWQRCKGSKSFTSDYGPEGTIVPNGMGPFGEEVTAPPNDAVIFVELSYDYQPLIAGIFGTSTEIKSHAAFLVRDKRDLTGLYQRDPAAPDATSDCALFNDYDIIVT